MNNDEFNERIFFDRVEEIFGQKTPDFSQSLNIAVIGKVSSGKSSLINALLRLSRREAMKVAKVGSISGVTKELTIIKLDDRVCLIDSPGLDDVRADNSAVTKNFLKHIDVGILVVTGSSDASQKEYLDDLKRNCDCVLVVLNKIDQFDDLDPSALDEVIDQWKNDLLVNKIYPICTKGYDPKSRSNQLDIRGVAVLRNDLEQFLRTQGKDLLLARHMAQKQSYAIQIIVSALGLVSAEAFLPSGGLLITATQASSLASLYYLYTGKIISGKTVLAILPTIIAETAGYNLYLFVESFLPPTIILDLVAAGIAVSITLALLGTVNHVLATGHELSEKELLRETFKTYHTKAQSMMVEIGTTDIMDFKSLDWSKIVAKFLSGS